MIITPLWHTEFLVDIVNSEWENIRILVDSWLSDYVAWDMMERTVKVRLDREKLSTIDAIYISHSHTDHLDPYTLREIYVHANPLILIPFTLAYLQPLLWEYLPNAEIVILKNHEPYILRGIEISGHMWQNPEITNEDDVMMLSVASEKEFLFAEIDSEPDRESLEVTKSLYRLMTKHDYESVLYIASRNVLEAALPILDLTESKRASFRAEFIAEEKEGMRFVYEKYEYEEFADFPRIFEIPGFARGFVGQGVAYPKILSETLFDYEIFPLAEIASMESDIAKVHGYEFSQKALVAGRQYRVEGWVIEQGRKECPIGEILKSERWEMEDISRNKKDRLYASGPLMPRDFSESDISEAKAKILEALNHRFLPYFSASPVASLRDALIENNGVYAIEFRVQDVENIIFEYSTTRMSFIEASYTEKTHIDEDYFLSDILDFLEWRQDLYSNFWHNLDPKRAYRLWMCLGANYMNHDLVERKYRLHFERAKGGNTVNEWVESIYKNII